MNRAALLVAVALSWPVLAAWTADAPPSDYAPTNFSVLGGFPFDIPDTPYNEKPNVKRLRPKISAMIPREIKSLNGKKVQLTGFMMPLDEEKGGARKFILMRNPISCCFGGANKLNEYVMVTMTGPKPAPFIPNMPIAVRGTISVGPDFEDGVLNGIYQMAGDEIRP